MMSRRLERVALLFAAGAGIGSIFPLARAAVGRGVPWFAYSLVASLGAAAVMLLLTALTGQSPRLGWPHLRYAAIAGFLTFALPFCVVPLVIAHIGSALPSILQSLAPLATIAIAYALGLERPRAARLIGLALGLAGTLAIVAGRLGGASSPSTGWLGVALIAPIALSCGNIYRTTGWPQGARALPLAAVTLLGAALWIALAIGLAILAGYPPPPVRPVLASADILVPQCLCLGFGYVCFFRLQEVAGPVFLSQISYVNTTVGLAFAVLWFSEPLSRWSWLGAVLVFGGVALVNRGQPAPTT